MSDNPNKLSQFWQELKRRKVLRVITVYAAVAFVILQLIEILAPSLRLPEWTMNFILVLLIVGFIIAVILSWIYDVHPEGGLEKTQPVHKVKEEETPKSSHSWKVASYISFVVIVALIVLNIVPRTGKKEILEKAIAVLPFRNDSSDPENISNINGTMESILNNLSKIKDLRVISRSSVEKYRDTDAYIPDVAEKLKVSYILEGSGQKYGDHIRMTLQLIDKNDRHIWSEQYDRKIEKVEDYIALQSEIAQLVAKEIEAVITPEEKQLIEKIPTINLSAYNFYQRGNEEYWKYWSDDDNQIALETAESLYHKALEYDSTFANAYSGLAKVFLDKHYWETFFTEQFLDSVLILADIALSYDDQLAEAYTIRGNYYRSKGLAKRAISEYDKAIKLNSNDWEAYYGKGRLYRFDDIIKTIDNIQKAASLNQGSELPALFRDIGWAYYSDGDLEKGNFYVQEALKLDGDSMRHHYAIGVGVWSCGNYTKAIESFEKAYSIDTSKIESLVIIGECHSFLGHNEESLVFYRRYLEKRKVLGIMDINRMQRIGYAYWQNGYKEEAEYYFDQQMNYCNEIIALGRAHSQQRLSFYDLAGIYAFKGEKDKAYENLRIYNQRERMQLWMVKVIMIDPLFDNIRDEPEFKQIVREVEAKYQAEHERVRQWLEENDR